MRKAYDTVDQLFIRDKLVVLNFPQHFIKIVMTCISTTQYSLLVNGNLSTVLKAKRGLRQGDPLSPLLFVIGMEYLSRSLHLLDHNPEFQFHLRYRKLKLKYLCFTDDLMLMCKGDLNSTKLICNTLDLFAQTLGLCPNLSKYAIYLAGITDRVKLCIAKEMHLPLGSLPFRYLGIPLTSKKNISY